MILTAITVMPNTHRRRESSWVASAVCIEFATSSWRLPTKIWKLNMLRIYPVELSRVVSAVHTHPSAVVTQFTILQRICDCRRKLETGPRLTTGAFTPPTQRNSHSLSANCPDSSRLSPTSCFREFKQRFNRLQQHAQSHTHTRISE